MNTGALLCLLCAHFVADFPLQFKFIFDLRNDQDKRRSFYGNTLHAGIHLILSAVSVIYFWSWTMFFVVLAISLSHLIIDIIKSKAISKRPFRKYSVYVFLIDQIGHLLCICLLFYVINYISPISALFKVQRDELQKFINSILASVTYAQKLVICLMLLIIGLWGIGVFIKIVLGRMSLILYERAINLNIELAKSSKSDGAANGGFIIGILERLFIIITIILNIPLVIGFILTVKSVARLKKFDDERFVEIFIIGSFISFISAIIIGYIIRVLLGMPIVYKQ